MEVLIRLIQVGVLVYLCLRLLLLVNMNETQYLHSSMRGTYKTPCVIHEERGGEYYIDFWDANIDEWVKRWVRVDRVVFCDGVF